MKNKKKSSQEEREFCEDSKPDKKSNGNRFDAGKIGLLFLTFLKIGAFTFGGGYAMIPLISRETSQRRHWVTQGDILDIVALAESTPGPIAVNAATFVGYQTAGFFGAFAATFGVVLPSFAILLALSFVLKQTADIPAVNWAFRGVRAAVLALILRALYTMGKQCPKHWFSYTVAALAFLLTAFSPISPIWVTIGCAILGLVASCFAARTKPKDDRGGN